MSALDTAVACYHAGNATRAAELCRKIVEGDPHDADAWHQRGLAEAALGRLELALNHLAQAVDLRPEAAGFRSNLALAWGMAGDWERAVEQYRRAVELRPHHAASLAKLGRALARTGRLDEAIGWLRRAVEIESCPDHWNALGTALAQSGEWEEAASSLLRAVALAPGHDEARQNLLNLSQAAVERGARYAAAGDWPAATSDFALATRADAANAEAHYNAGLAHTGLGDLPRARRSYETAIALRPAYPEAWNNLAHVVLALGDSTQALDCAHRATTLRPEYFEAHYNTGVILQTLDRPEEAVQAYEQVLRLAPDHAEAMNNLGSLALGRNEFGEAIARFDEALVRNPSHIDARWNRGLAHLTLRNWREGWKGYQARVEREEYRARRLGRARWNGEDLSGKSLLIWAEQGLGDTIQFLRCVPSVAARAATVWVECQPRLQPLVACAGLEAIERGGRLPEADFDVPLLSLPHLLSMEPESVPPPGPRIALPSARLRYWKEAVRAVEGFHAGVVWGAQAANFAGRARSMPLASLEPLSRVAGVRVISLQHGPQAAEMAACPWICRLEEPHGDILDTAALIANLDLVITVDTMTAHLAGLLGKPVWTLLPHSADWRWMQVGDPVSDVATVWYPTMRLFRQPLRGDWSSVVRMVQRRLEEVVSAANIEA